MFGKKTKKSPKGIYRIEELEDKLAESGLEGIDEEAIVSMYMPKRRAKRIGAALLRLGTLQKVLLILALILALMVILKWLDVFHWR